MTAATVLERQAQCQLNDSGLRVRAAAGTRDLTERSRCDIYLGVPEQRMVHCIEYISPELDLSLLIDVGNLRDAHIDVRSRWTAKRVPPKRAVRSLRRIVDRIKSLSGRGGQRGSGERVRIEEKVTGLSADSL